MYKIVKKIRDGITKMSKTKETILKDEIKVETNGTSRNKSRIVKVRKLGGDGTIGQYEHLDVIQYKVHSLWIKWSQQTENLIEPSELILNLWQHKGEKNR